MYTKALQSQSYVKAQARLVKSLLLFIIATGQFSLCAQPLSIKGHSHNDYRQKRPFYCAYENKLGSIEADIWAVDSLLYVAHDRWDIKKDRTLAALYIDPVKKVFDLNNGQAWQQTNGSFQLLIDLKSPAVPTLGLLVKLLESNPEVFDRSKNPDAVAIVISGSRPEPEDFVKYPGFISFDGTIGVTYTSEQLSRIPLFSGSFKEFSNWNGKGPMPLADRERIIRIVSEIHRLGKKVRFWEAPDTIEAWNEFLNAGIDFINTDQPEKFAEYCSGMN